MASVIFHIDINAFFASAEELKRPELKDKPLAIGSMARRSVISTANYVAREKGVHSAMPVYEALSLCPELVLIEGDYNYYRMLSSRFFTYLKKYTNQIEPASIDECYMDVTNIIKRFKRPLDLAYQIQKGVHDLLGLDVSIGVAPNRFLAKMASDMKKPRGITVLRISEIEYKLWPLPIEEMHGIGKKTVPLLKKEGIHTIGDFADPANEQKIERILKNSAYAMIQKARGHSSAKLHYSTTQKSCSVSRTYTTDLFSIEDVYSKARELCQNLSYKCMQDNQKGKLVSLSLRDLEFHTIVRSAQLNHYANSFHEIYEVVQGLIDQNFEPIGYRFIAITLGSLMNGDKIIEQPSLFQIPIEDSRSILNSFNKELNSNVFKMASDLLKEKENE